MGNSVQGTETETILATLMQTRYINAPGDPKNGIYVTRPLAFEKHKKENCTGYSGTEGITRLVIAAQRGQVDIVGQKG